ncbi:MAG: orotidine-5'-phosphate decarboxylase [Thermodesulfobacteriota bacterium]|nr:orotidine-5'-phosphate decarboxylase [Thermodesulfobacteriota bacterium]
MQTSNNNSRSKLIFALDLGDEMDEAIKWVDLLKDHVGMFKIGKEAFTRFGPSVVSMIIERGGNAFLDLKFHDIPNTVAMAAGASVRLGISMLNIHALGGREMMERAVDSVKNTAATMNMPSPVLLAVTVLTSLDDSNLEEMGFNCSASALALKLAVSARDAGVSGVVASARDIIPIREACGKDFVIVTPGIRLSGEVAGDDQKRVLTPKNAITMGADYIVVGRPIRLADDPVATAELITSEISDGLVY